MLTILIITENPAFGKSLEQRLLTRHSVPAGRVHFVPVGAEPNGQYILREFHRLHEEIAKYIRSDSGEGTSPLLIVTDLQGYAQFDVERLNLLEDSGWTAVLGMLILSFPEVHWAFAGSQMPKGVPASLQPCFLDQDTDFSSLLEWMEGGQLCPLFDPCGLRNAVRKISIGKDQHVIPVRYEAQAAAIDDEREYALLHGYVAYRFGYCSHVVTSSQMMSRLFSREATHSIQLVFEDLFLNFADMHILGLSDLRVRDGVYPRLAAVPMRVIVTTGSERPLDHNSAHHNKLYLTALNAQGVWTTVIRKPVPGIFKLWEGSGISRHVREVARNEGREIFIRLPHKVSRRGAGHSTPGRLVEIAKRLLDRAAVDQENPRSACSLIYRALLATDALELLGGKTPTTSLLALAESHELEALAECQFLGVEGDFDVGIRLSEIRREISALSLFYGRPSREFSAWNAESSITQRLVQTFRDHNKFNEEAIVEIREREIHRRIWFQRHLGIFGGMLRWLNPAYVASWYFEMLMRSMSNFVLAILLWIAGLTALYATHSASGNWLVGLEKAILNFFAIQSGTPDLGGLLVELVGLVGLLHLGVLIAHFYAVISRR